MDLLLTGFEPFGGSTINPSEQVIRRLDQASITDARVHTRLLPVDRVCAPQQLIDCIHTLRPGAIICFGEAAGRTAISIERAAINLLDFRIPDNTGSQAVDEPVVPGGPAAYFSTLPVRALYTSLLDSDIPAELSLSAGTYLCNQVFYSLMHDLSLNGRSIPAGFIHLPALPEQAAQQKKSLPTMGLELMVEAVIKIIQITVQSAHSE
jgi:pyroglutamyl-peptidase